jgi:hypothetical protein
MDRTMIANVRFLPLSAGRLAAGPNDFPVMTGICMLRTSIVALTLSLCLPALTALAQDVNEIEGLYSGQGEGELTVDITHIEGDRYGVAINTLVPMVDDMPGCAGDVSGEAVLTGEGGTLQAANEFYDPNGDTPSAKAKFCEVDLTFDGAGKLVIDERDGCISYHGAACGFSGELMHDAAGL